MATTSRRAMITTASGAAAAVVLSGHAAAAPQKHRTVPSAQPNRTLLTDPFLQSPQRNSVRVVWFTEFEGDRHCVVWGRDHADVFAADTGRLISGRLPKRVGRGVAVVSAVTTKMSRTAEDAASFLPEDRRPTPEQGIVSRDVWRHEALVEGIPENGRTFPYRVVSSAQGAYAQSDVFELRGGLKKGEPGVIMLTSDHQAMIDTPANMHFAKQTIEKELGAITAVFFAGDLVNIPDRASEWFDDSRGSAFFPTLQGAGHRVARNGVTYAGAPIIQNAPLYPAIGNHEVQGRVDGHTQLNASFGNPVPRAVVEAEYGRVADEVNPTGDPAVRDRWIEDNSFSTRTYEEVFSLPGNERYYAASVGNVRLITLFVTRIWRWINAEADPAARTATSRYQEAASVLDAPLQRGYGEFIFEDVAVDSDQYRWLERELASKETRKHDYTVVMLHEGPHGLGDNMDPQFVHPVEVQERNADGQVIGIRYEYPREKNVVLHDLAVLLERHDVDLVYNGHSHLWNRFVSSNGKTHYLEASNTGNTYGAFHPLSGRRRHVPPAPWDAEDYTPQGDPGGLTPVVPALAPLKDAQGQPLPYVSQNGLVVFQALETATGTVHSWYVDLHDVDAGAVRFDEFRLG